MSDIGIVRLKEKEESVHNEKSCRKLQTSSNTNVKRSISRQITRPKMKPAGRRIGFLLEAGGYCVASGNPTHHWAGSSEPPSTNIPTGSYSNRWATRVGHLRQECKSNLYTPSPIYAFKSASLKTSPWLLCINAPIITFRMERRGTIISVHMSCIIHFIRHDFKDLQLTNNLLSQDLVLFHISQERETRGTRN